MSKLLWDGVEAGIAEGLVGEVAKRGYMRGASQGLFVDMATITGPCHRAALARMLGGAAPKEDDWNQKQLMFDSGHANEVSWVANLARSWDGPILREEEVPISWHIETEAGASADGSGRADIVLCRFSTLDEIRTGTGLQWLDPADSRQKRVIPVQGIELKQVSSVGTAADVLFPESGKPKLAHAIQAGRYMKQLGIPWQLWYTLPFVCPIPSWSFITPKIPRQGEPGSEMVDYSKRGEATKIQPSAVGYHLAFHEGRLHYSRVGEEAAGWVATVITEEGLDDFWRFTLDAPILGDLGPRPTNMDILGEREFWSLCDYCEWKPTCDAHEDDYSAWEAEVKGMIPDLPTSQKK